MCENNPCKNYELCSGYIPTYHPDDYLCSGGDPNLCINCAMMVRCKNYELCSGYNYLCSGGEPKLCTNCAMMFRKGLLFKDNVECPICFETKRAITQPNCEHMVCIQCFSDCYYGIFNEPEFPYSKGIEKKYIRLCCKSDSGQAHKSFLDKYPLIYKYEEEYTRRLDKQEETKLLNSRCPLCRK